MNSHHLFSFFYEKLSSQIKGLRVGNVLACDEEIAYRIDNVLRLRDGDEILLFDQNIHIKLKLQILKNNRNIVVKGVLDSIEKSKTLAPEITLYAALLKKNSFEEVAYVAAQMGVKTIVPLISERVQRDWGDAREHARLQACMIAACEQAKQFVIPALCNPVRMEQKSFDLLFPKKEPFEKRIFFEAEKTAFTNLAQDLLSNKTTSLSIAIGPEAGFTDNDQRLLEQYHFTGYALTPTILRATEAVTVSLGALRSLTIAPKL